MNLNLKIRNAIISAMAVVMLSSLFYNCKKSLSTDSLYVPTAADATTTATLADLQSGRDLFISKCGACHSLYVPESLSASSWKSIVPVMAAKTNLTAAEIVLVTKYVTKGK